MMQSAQSNHIKLVPAEQQSRQQRREQSEHPALWRILDEVKDPEIPVLSIWDMGILQNIERDGAKVVVTITPTYSGCPAMDVIKEDIDIALTDAGYFQSCVLTQLSPAWSTDWMSNDAQQRLRGYGIAAPDDTKSTSNDSADNCGVCHIQNGAQVKCPQCSSVDTELVSEFGSTACKALFKCQSCLEPFDYFKRI